MPRIDPLGGSLPVLPFVPDDELETPPLPREHPKWVKDAVALSHRARQILAHLRPAIVRVLTFWDHHVRGIVVGGRELSVDISGSYRIES
jgi:hypothetical protein